MKTTNRKKTILLPYRPQVFVERKNTQSATATIEVQNDHS